MLQPQDLERAFLDLHGCKARHIGSKHVRETFKGEVVWEGHVEIFELEGHATATTGYAWDHALDDTKERRVVAVLHQGPIVSPEAAVRGAIASEIQAKEPGE